MSTRSGTNQLICIPINWYVYKFIVTSTFVISVYQYIVSNIIYHCLQPYTALYIVLYLIFIFIVLYP